MGEPTTASFTLADALRADCHVLGRLALCQVLLVNKAEVPWFIAVPQTTVIELCDLSALQQTQLQGDINQLARWLRVRFAVTKLNIAAIGNIVPQLHIHIIGRHPDDVWWPGVAWGQASTQRYPSARVAQIATMLEQDLGSAYRRL